MGARSRNSQGRISNLIRLAEADADALKEYARKNFSKMYEYYDASTQAYIDAVESGQSVTIVPTPFHVNYRALTVYLLPELRDKLQEISKAHGTHIGREIATAVTFLVRN
ncbi:hypothetical protein [Nisaea sp.]